MVSWWGKISGEISKLRGGLLGVTAGSIGGYSLDTSKVDYEITKQLYYNTNDSYKLGAGFAKPIINNKVSFMGIPEFKSKNPDAQLTLNSFFDSNASNMQRTERDALRDGDCFVQVTLEDQEDRLLFPEQPTRLVYDIIPPGQVVEIKRDPLTGTVLEYVLESFHQWVNEKGEKKKGTVTQRIRRGEKVVEVKDDIPDGVEIGTQSTPWDFIPIIHFKNEGDEGVYGQSELEAVEPYLKAYHDILLHAIKGSKMHSTPRLKLKIKSLSTFLKNNFGVKDAAEFAKNGGTLDLDGQELLLMEGEDDASFIEVKSATGDAQVLLKLLFYCIVDASETPEFVFGVHTPSSLSSVKEQMPILIRSIERKREHFAESWQRMARIVLAMTAHSENTSYETYHTELKWVNIEARTGEEISKEILNIVNALVAGLNNNIISEESAVNYLAKLIDTMNKYEEEDGENEKDRINATRLNRLRMPDSDDLQGQLQEIKSRLNGREGDGET